MNSGGPHADRDEGYVYRRRYLDEDAWKLALPDHLPVKALWSKQR